MTVKGPGVRIPLSPQDKNLPRKKRGFFMAFYVYILYSNDFDRYYIGQSADVAERLKRHNLGMETATKPYKPWILVCFIEKPDRGSAMVLERKLKNLNRPRLLAFIEKYGSGGRDDAP